MDPNSCALQQLLNMQQEAQELEAKIEHLRNLVSEIQAKDHRTKDDLIKLEQLGKQLNAELQNFDRKTALIQALVEESGVCLEVPSGPPTIIKKK